MRKAQEESKLVAVKTAYNSVYLVRAPPTAEFLASLRTPDTHKSVNR
jgi:hypothetical protein